MGIALVCYLYLSQDDKKDCTQDCLPIELNQQVTATEQVTVKELSQPGTIAQNKTYTEKRLSASNNASQPKLSLKQSANKQSGKKHYDDDWCFAKNELSESDYDFAQTELKDWERLIGKARAGNSVMAGRDEVSFPNNSFIESYEELPIEELQVLALQGDKWAMITYLQDERPSFNEGNKFKDKFANELLVQGGSYYALQHIVLNLLGEARTSLRQSNKEKAIEHITDALAYAYWGLEHYNDAGLGSFIAITSGERFKKTLLLDEVLPYAVESVRSKLAKLTESINEQRSAKGIDFPEAPHAVKKWFAKDMAIREKISKQSLDFLRSLNIKEDSPIKATPCTEQHIDWFRERDG